MIGRFTHDMDFDTFSEDPKTVSAVERKLQIVSEAAIRLLKPRRESPAWPGEMSAALGTGSGTNTTVSNCRLSGKPLRMICRH